jgi:Family of unknown function (DUF6339)
MADEMMFRFELPLTPAELPKVLEGKMSPSVCGTGIPANLEPVERAFQRLASKASTKRSDYDVLLCELLHKQLKHLPASLLVDMRFWHWLAVKRFAKFVWTRWHGSVPEDVGSALARGGMSDRFLGRSTLRGRNRNALARLYFTAAILHDRIDGYTLAASAFANQDRHTSLFERKMGLVPAAAKALVRVTKGMGSEEIQKAAKRLNHIGSSLVFEIMDERDLITLLK